MKKIRIAKDAYTIVDDEDYQYLSQFKWYYNKHRGYAHFGGRHSDLFRNKALMHRVILGLNDKSSSHIEVDHINRDKLDNRKSNLRLCDHSSNQSNSKLRVNNSSGYRGVHWNKATKMWRCKITRHGKTYELGYFSDRIEAAKVYNDHSVNLFGEFAYLNPI